MKNMPEPWPHLLGFNELSLKENASVIAEDRSGADHHGVPYTAFLAIVFVKSFHQWICVKKISSGHQFCIRHSTL